MEYVHKMLSEPNCLVHHHLESYNQFLDRIPIILHKKNPITILKKQVDGNFQHECNIYIGGKKGDDIIFGNPMFYENGVQKIMYPNDARLRNMTYAFSIHVKVTYTFTIQGVENESLEFTTPFILLGYFPIMLHSNVCVLHSMPNSRFNMGECTSDQGGYFIVDGSEKAIVCQEGRANNIICVMKNFSDKYYYGAIIKSESEDETKLARSTTVYIVTKEDKGDEGINQLTPDKVSIHQIVVELPDVHIPIPLFIVMRALGIISDKQIIETCLQGDDTLLPYFHDSICDAGSIYTQAMAIQFIGTFTKYHSIHYSLRILSELFLPHIGELNFLDKAFFLGYMVKKVLRVAVGIDRPTERDSYRFKRVDTTGVLLTHLFTDFYSKQLKDMQRVIDRTYNKNEKVYDDPQVFPSLFKTNYPEFFQERVAENGILSGFKGRWGATSYTQKVGVAQKLNRLSFNSATSHLRKCVLQLDKSAKVTAPRLLHTSQWGMFDPVDTPDGGDVGTHKHLALAARITEGFPKQKIFDEIIHLKINVIPLETFANIPLYVKLFINGEWHGCLPEPEEAVHLLRMSRRHGRLPMSTSISWNIGENILYIFTDSGRLQRPLFYVENGKMVEPDPALSWKELIQGNRERPCFIEYLDTEESNTSLISFSNENLTRHTHVEIHSSLLLGFMGNQIIFPEHSPLPRNAFSCGQSKQAVSLYHTNYQNRMDTMGVVLNYGQQPLIQSSFLSKFKTLPYGVNAIVGIMCYTGYNTEDAILFNRASLERGMFNTSYFKTYEMSETAGEEPVIFEGGSNTDENGLAPLQTKVSPETVLMRMVSGTRVKNIHPKRDQLGHVDRVFITDHPLGHRMAKVRICHERSPSIGDKFASRAGQKGTCGLILNEEDMPFTSEGIRPDLIINPHALPSRMTLGQLIESVLGKANLKRGGLGDCTAFNTENHYKEELTSMGFHSSGTEILCNGMTGEILESDIFIGPTYYLRLKHMVEDKINFRERGPMTTLTRQPVQGRSNEGGLRIGEMERDGVIANGMSSFVRESMMIRGDGTMLVNSTRKPYHICVDNNSGMIAVHNETKLQRSMMDSNYEGSFSVLNVPYSFKLLLQELGTMNVQMRLITSDNLSHFESMRGKEISKPSFLSLSNEIYSVKDNKLYVSNESFVVQNGISYPNCFDETKVFEHEQLNPTMFPCIESDKEMEQLRVSVREIVPTPYTSIYHKDRCSFDIYNTTPDSFDTTLDYYWSKMKTGIFVRIKNNKVFNFILMYNVNYRNDFDIKNIKDFMESLPAKKKRQTSEDSSTWHATNCLLRAEKKHMDKDPNEAYLPQFYDMLVETCSHRKVNDCMFFMTRKDFPHLRKDWKESFDSIYGDVEMNETYKNKSFIPVVAQSTTVNHADFPFPTGDDWEDICKDKWFASYANKDLKCKNDSTKLQSFPSWETRKDEIIWRGQGTGCGNTSETNPRMKLDELTREGSIPGLNARIVRFTDRIKAVQRDGGLHVEYKGSENLDELRISMEQQVAYKFIINVEGNSAAYRFGSLLGMGFCILNVDSIYTLWFEPMLQKSLITDKDIQNAHCIRVNHDLSNLGEVVAWCKEHDDLCKQISENAMRFYKKHFTKDFIYDYVTDLCNSVSSVLTIQKNIYSLDEKKVKSLRSKSSLNVLSCKDVPSKQNKTIIIVPYRDDGNQNRSEQLKQFLNHYKNIPILIVEQSKDDKKFNRGALLNIGYDFCTQQLPSITTFVIHDVDILMSQDVIQKYYVDDEKGLMHLGSLIKSEKYNDSKFFLGRVIRFSKEVYKKINGFPNTFYGWGGEDDALVYRISMNSIPLYRPDESKQGSEMTTTNDIFITKDKAFIEEHKIEQLIADELQWKIDGVNSLQYSLVEHKTLNEWCHKITVQLAPTAEYTKEEKVEKVVEKENNEIEVLNGTETLEIKEKIKIVVL
jgi:DNA-directed RNA polymerase II subunit RPB2